MSRPGVAGVNNVAGVDRLWRQILLTSRQKTKKKLFDFNFFLLFFSLLLTLVVAVG
jgi:hypothetical protein